MALSKKEYKDLNKSFITTFNNVKRSIEISNFDKELINYVIKKDKITFLQGNDLKESLNTLKDFDINLLYDKDFWGIKTSESICAVATGYYNFVKAVKSGNYDN